MYPVCCVQPAYSFAMKRYEYAIARHLDNIWDIEPAQEGQFPDEMTVLSHMGEHGWELVGVFGEPTQLEDRSLAIEILSPRFYFKRKALQ